MSSKVSTEDIVSYIVDPESPQQKPRFNDGYAATKTAVTVTTAEFDNVWHNPTGGDDGATMAVAQFYEPLRSYAIYTRNSLGTGSNSYQWIDSSSATQFLAPAHSQVKIRPSGATPFAPTNDLTLHGDVLWPGLDDNQDRYLWQDADGSPSSYILVTVNTITATSGQVLLYRSDGRTSAQPVAYPFSSLVPVTGSTSLLSIPITQNGYYRIEVANNDSTNYQFSFVQTCWGNAFWAQVSMNSYDNAVNVFLSICADSNKLVWRNSGAPLYVNGEMMGAEFGPGYDVQTLLLEGATSLYALFTTCSKQMQSKSDKFSNGLQSSLRPNDLDTFELKKPVTFLNVTGSQFTGGYNIANQSPFKLFVAKVSPIVNNAVASSAQTQMRIATGVRYETNQQTQNPEAPNTEAGQWQDAVMRMRKLPIYYPKSGAPVEDVIGSFV